MEEALKLIPEQQDIYTLIFWSASWLSFILSLILLYKSRFKSQLFILLGFVQFIMGALLFDLYLARSGQMKYVLWYNDVTEWMVISIGPGLFVLSKVLLEKRPVSSKYLAFHFTIPLSYLVYQFLYIIQPVEAKYNAYVGSFHPDLPMLYYSCPFPIDPLHIKEHFELISTFIH